MAPTNESGTPATEAKPLFRATSQATHGPGREILEASWASFREQQTDQRTEPRKNASRKKRGRQSHVPEPDPAMVPEAGGSFFFQAWERSVASTPRRGPARGSSRKNAPPGYTSLSPPGINKVEQPNPFSGENKERFHTGKLVAPPGSLVIGVGLRTAGTETVPVRSAVASGARSREVWACGSIKILNLVLRNRPKKAQTPPALRNQAYPLPAMKFINKP